MDDAPGGAPARPVDNAGALPTARAFAHMPTAFDYRSKNTEHPHPLQNGFTLAHRAGMFAGYSMRDKRGGELQISVGGNKGYAR